MIVISHIFVCIHSTFALLGFSNPNFSCLVDLVLNVPFRLLSLDVSSDLLNLCCDFVDRQCLPSIIVRAWSGVVPRFVAMETYDKGHLVRLSHDLLGVVVVARQVHFVVEDHKVVSTWSVDRPFDPR